MSECPISLIVQPSGGRNLFLHQHPCNFGHTRPVIGKIKDFFNNPASLNVNHNSVFDFGMSDVAEGRIGKGTFSCGILGMKCGLDLAAGVLGKPFISQPRIKNDGLCFDITDKIVVDVNVPFLVIVHGIAFADLDFLNQPHQRGTV